LVGAHEINLYVIVSYFLFVEQPTGMEISKGSVYNIKLPKRELFRKENFDG